MTKIEHVRRIQKTIKKLSPKVSGKFLKTLADSLELFNERRHIDNKENCLGNLYVRDGPDIPC